MPIHDWTRVDAGIYHHFHHEWISSINHALNRGLLPAGWHWRELHANIWVPLALPVPRAVGCHRPGA